MKNEKNEKIILCPTCEGTGLETETIYGHPHNNEIDYKFSDCKTCKGKGRVLKETTIKYIPLNNSSFEEKAIKGKYY